MINTLSYNDRRILKYDNIVIFCFKYKRISTQSTSEDLFSYLPNLQPSSLKGQRPKTLNRVVGIQTIINKISASAKLNINKFVGVCMPLLSPIPISTSELPIRPSTKKVLNKHIFTMPNQSSYPFAAL